MWYKSDGSIDYNLDYDDEINFIPIFSDEKIDETVNAIRNSKRDITEFTEAAHQVQRGKHTCAVFAKGFSELARMHPQRDEY